MNNNLRLNLDLRLGGLRVGSREKLYDREVCLQTGVQVIPIGLGMTPLSDDFTRRFDYYCQVKYTRYFIVIDRNRRTNFGLDIRVLFIETYVNGQRTRLVRRNKEGSLRRIRIKSLITLLKFLDLCTLHEPINNNSPKNIRTTTMYRRTTTNVKA